MIYVGIDISKLNHYAAAIDSDGVVQIESFEFTNDNDGFYMLVSKLEQFESDSIIIGLESTAHYGNNLVSFLVSKGFHVCVISPIQTSSLRGRHHPQRGQPHRGLPLRRRPRLRPRRRPAGAGAAGPARASVDRKSVV